MARHEKDFPGTSGEPLHLDALAALLADVERGLGASRDVSIACALSASEGWQDAVKRLHGAFAEQEAGLSARKGERTDD